MLKLNSTGGKLDITISDEAVFGTNRKSTIKQPQRRAAVPSRTSNTHGKQQSKPPAATFTERGQKGRESRQAKPIKKVAVVKQTKPKFKQGQKAVKPQEVSTSIPARDGSNKSGGSSVITQAKLDGILSLLNNTQGNGTGTSLSPEQLSVLVTSLSKVKATEPQANEESLNQQSSKTHVQRTDPKATLSSKATTENTVKQDNQVDNKKAEWKRELDEQVTSKKKAKELDKQKQENAFVEYNPWGRPGAGAPIRSQSGKVLADYHHRAAKEHVQISNQENVSSTSILQTSTPNYGTTTTTNQAHPSPVATIGHATTNIDTTLPVALRSSFAVGAPGLVSHDTQQKQFEELKWKQELEKQIEEKKEWERQRKLKEEQEDFLNISWSNKHTRPVPKEPAHHVADTPSQTSVVRQDKYSPENNIRQGAQDSTSPLLNASLDGSLNRTHARGFGMHSMDPQSKDEAEKKRSKMLEHQRAIQEQVEEHRRKKQQEKEERLKEEAIEEARLARERDVLNEAFVVEQKRKREKEEEAKRVTEALQQSVLDAYEASQQVKMEKRRKHLETGGHTTARGGGATRSYVVSRGSSLAHQDSITSLQDNRHPTVDIVHENRQSNYTTPRVTGRDSPKTKLLGGASKASKSRISRNEPYVPPLNLIRGDSPPVPALRSKIQHVKPTSHRSTTPASVNDRRNRTVSSHSEPCYGSMALSTRKDTLRKELEDVLTSHEEMTSARFLPEEGSASFDLIEDAFMIPYHRTDSATLPAAPETPEDSTPTETKPAPRTKANLDKKTTKKFLTKDGSNVTSMPYRSASTHLKPDKTETKMSPRRTKLKQTKPALPPRVSRSVKDSSTNRSVSQSKRKPDVGRTKQTNDKISPRMNVSSGLSTHQETPEPTARQEMILHQLAALRQGLILKERELKQGL